MLAAGPPEVVVKGIPTNGEIHNGGALAMAPDQNGHGHFLYWSCGNNGIDRGYRLDNTILGSKIGRANLDGSWQLVRDMRGSTSWRLTAPLRNLRRTRQK